MKTLLLSLSIFFISLTESTAQLAIPELWGMRVHDEAKLLSAQAAHQLESELKVFEDSTSNQIALLIIPSLNGEALEDYSFRVSEAWKLGTKDRDNGVLILIAINDRKMRIEVGSGLEGPLPDVICNRIIRNEIAPAFRREEYDAGIVNGVHAVMQAIKGEYKGSDSPIKVKKKGGSLLTLLIIFIVITIIGRIRGGGNNKGGGWSSGAGWFTAGMLLGGGGRGGDGGGFGGFSGGGGGFGGGGSSGSW